MAETLRDYPDLSSSSILQWYCVQLNIQLPQVGYVTQWIVDQLRNVQVERVTPPESVSQEATAFKADLLNRLKGAAGGDSRTSALANYFQQRDPEDLYGEMIINVRGYLIGRLLQQLEQSTQRICEDRQGVFFNRGTLNTSVIANALQLAEKIREAILPLLNLWKTSQVTSTAGLHNIQAWYERLFAQNWSILLDMSVLLKSCPSSSLTQLLKQSTNQVTVLLKDGFYVEKQPPQVLLIDSQQQVIVKHFFGQWVYDKLKYSEMKACIVSESKAREILQNGHVLPEVSCGQLEYEKAVLKCDPETRMISAEFRNLQVKQVNRSDPNGESHEKFALLFYFSIQSGELSFVPWVLSVPLVVNTDSSQKILSLATIIWDNANLNINRADLFQTPSVQPWGQLSTMLSQIFLAETGRKLTGENLNFLCEKAFHWMPPQQDTQPITLSQFSGQKLPGRDFTFWEWLYAAMQLIKDHFCTPWAAGHVVGFFGKPSVEKCLQGRPAGTFLLRFSDSLKGAITIAYVAKLGIPTIRHVEPFTDRELANIPLADRIAALNDLQCVFPNVPKAKVFVPGAPTKPNLPGYVLFEVEKIIQNSTGSGSAGGGSGNQQPNTKHKGSSKKLLGLF